MNLFTHRQKLEDHITNILINILSVNESLLESFLLNLLEDPMVDGFKYNDVYYKLFHSDNPNSLVDHQLILGIAPSFTNENLTNTVNNRSVPDAWIYGKNFTILIENKVNGSLDPYQISKHQSKFSNSPVPVIQRSWLDVAAVLKEISKTVTTLEKYLIDEFISILNSNGLTKGFQTRKNKHRRDPRIISHKKAENHLYFQITGDSKKPHLPYTIDQRGPHKDNINPNAGGIVRGRKWIANYVMTHLDEFYPGLLPEEIIINDYCVVPDRPQNKNEWNQWYLKSFLV